jgi:hypothetical protein
MLCPSSVIFGPDEFFDPARTILATYYPTSRHMK